MPAPIVAEYFKKIHRIISALDETNFRIIQCIREYGPRNLQRVARKAKIPYPTVHARVSKLEKQGILRTWASPSYAKIGLIRATVLLTPTPGKDLLAGEALKIPGYWLRIMRCMGECNGYYSIHAVPEANRSDFQQYLDQLVASNLAREYRIYWLEDQHTSIPNFEYYDTTIGKWRFTWETWLRQLSDHKLAKHAKTGLKTPSRPPFDKKDLIILKELMKNARVTLANLAGMLGTTVPGAKYRFDKIRERGFIHEFVVEFLPYAPEISELYEVRLDFKNESSLISKTSTFLALPFTLHQSQIRGMNSVAARVYLPRGEMSNLYALLSRLVRNGILSNFAYLLLDPLSIKAQTFSYEYYDDEEGWGYDNNDYISRLQNLLTEFEGNEAQQAVFRPMSIATTA
ncbi:winged helix-turn-helix transcriptional regulator [Candidatus Bathyarchaeota archaeon]|nr:MAG: winged helix-turn-helix transcriptional regulator [Candidatus Bathyarchaeota archaeon]